MRNCYYKCFGGKLKCDIGLINVIIFYRFNYNKNIDELIAQITAFTEQLSNEPSVILGDFNFDVLKCDEVVIIRKNTLNYHFTMK